MDWRHSTAAIFLILFIGFAAAQPIQLKGNSFTPSESSPQIQQFETQTQEYKLLQFHGATTQEQRQEVSERGVEFISYIPENAWLVKLNGDRNEVISEKKVRYLGPYRSEYKISPELQSEISENSGEVEIQVEMFNEDNAEEVLSNYGELNGKFGSKTWKLRTKYSEIPDIADEKQVRWISPEAPSPSTMNDDARKLIGSERLQESPYNLTGDGFTVSIWDEGWAGNHEDLNYTDSKLTVGDRGESCGETYEPTSNCQVKQHGTHVSGTMLGAGIIDNTYRGVAPNTSLVTYEWPGNESDISAEEEAENEINESINQYSSIISQNSWGYSADAYAGLYSKTYLSRVYDSIVAEENSRVVGDTNVVFSAGNFRDQVSRDYNTTMPPSTGKNVITVGAVDRNKDMTAFSSWGPTDDGRIKPTLVADGGGDCNSVGQSVYSTIPTDDYGGLCGTSMAAPAVAGASVQINEKFNNTYGELPEPATTKGVLIHNAEDLNRTGPDYITGWGLVNTTEAVEYVDQSETQELIQTGRIENNGSESLSVSIPKGESLNFTLVWSDYPASSGAAEALVNDLDLVVKNSSGHRYYPWTLNWSIKDQQAVRTKKDERNVVEQVFVPETKSGEFTVKVNGTSIQQGPQNYSLMLDSQVQVVPNLSIESPSNKSYNEVPDFNLSSSNDLSDAKFSLNGNKNYSMQEKNSTYFYNTSTEIEDGQYEAVFWANDTEGDWSSETVSFTLDREAPNITALNPEEGENISGVFNIDATWRSATEIEKSKFIISDGSVVKEGDLNASPDSANFADGNYNITYNVSDAADNFNSTEVSVTFDNTDPEIQSYDPEDGDYFDSNFFVNATWQDETTGVSISNYEFENSSLQASGTLNDTIDASDLKSGKYNLTYILEDYAGNRFTKQVEISMDRENPSLEVLNPEDDSYVDQDFSVEASYSDNLSGVSEANYTVSNGTEQLSGSFNDTLDTSNLAEGQYNVTFNVTDNIGNFNSSEVNLTLDKTNPELNFTEPESGLISGNFSVNATFSDTLSGVEYSNYTLENSSVQASGSLNDTLNSSEFADGGYSLSADVSDRAGNPNTSSVSVEFDNSAPEISSSSIVDKGNYSGVLDFEVEFTEISSVENASFKLYNASGNQTSWRDLNYSDLNTSNFSDGVYKVSVQANDTLGNYMNENTTDVTFDSTRPEISLVEYNDTEVDGWAKDEKTVEVQCSDSGSNVQNVSVADKTNSSTPANFTITETGENSFSFTCRDFAGNKDVEERTLKVDSRKPELEDVSPEGETSREFELIGEISDESDESGIDRSSSYLSANPGSLENLEWTNDSFTADVSGLDYGESYSIAGEIEDNVGQTYNVELDYTVESETTSSPSGGGGGAPAPTQEMDVEEDSENTTNDQNETQDLNSGDSSETDGCQGGSAVNPEEDSCRDFSGCVPDDWEKVKSCQVWNEKQEAQELLNNISEDNADQELLQRAQTEFEEGNYSGVKRLASQARESSSEQLNGLPLILIPLILLLLGAGSFFGYRYYQRRQLEEEIRRLSDEILSMVDEGEIAQEKEFVDSIIQAYQAIDMGKRERAEQKLEQFYTQAEREGLDISRTNQ
jgi:hypothetical protein